MGIIENFDDFRNDTAIKEYTAHSTKALFSQNEKQSDDDNDAKGDTNPVL
jgi:hypothetical protein